MNNKLNTTSSSTASVKDIKDSESLGFDDGSISSLTDCYKPTIYGIFGKVSNTGTSDSGITLIPSPKISQLLSLTLWPSAQETSPHLRDLNWIREIAKLSDSELASLLNVTRRTVLNWKQDKPHKDANFKHLVLVRDIIERAYNTIGQSDTSYPVRQWLFTPRGPKGETPFDMISNGHLNEARFYACSIAPKNLDRRKRPISKDIARNYVRGSEYRIESLGLFTNFDSNDPGNED